MHREGTNLKGIRVDFCPVFWELDNYNDNDISLNFFPLLIVTFITLKLVSS